MRSEKLVIETPEKIIFTYDVAELGTRMVAYTLDSLIQIAVLVVLIILGSLGTLVDSGVYDDQPLLAIALVFIVLFFFQWGYFLFFETVMNGRTPGKKACRLRVIGYSGERLDFQSLAIRNLLRAADSLPFPFLNFLGGLVAILNKKNRRLGDFAAGTIVVKDSARDLIEPSFTTKITSKSKGLFKSPLGKGKLSEKDLYILRRLLNERSSMPKEAAERTAKSIVDKLNNLYDLSMLTSKSNFEIIEEIYKAHTYEN